MTQFASKTGRDLNRDPKPYVTPEGRRSSVWTRHTIDRPRPEFDHVQHNEPNPILVARRLNPDGDIYYRDLPEWPTFEQREHAQKVLSRLSALKNGGQ